MCDCWKCLKSCPVRKLFTWFIWWWRVHCWQYNTRRVLKDYSFVYLSFLDSLQRRDLILCLCPCRRAWYMSFCFRCLFVVAALSLQLRPVCVVTSWPLHNVLSVVCRSPPTLSAHSARAAHVAVLWVILYANGNASCPLSAGARVGFPHSWRLTPPLPCLLFPFNSSLPSGDRGYRSRPVAPLCLFSLTHIYWSSLLA